MRSNASSCTGPAGLANAQASGTRVAPAASATAMAPALGTEVPRTASSSPAPFCSGGNPPGLQEVGIGGGTRGKGMALVQEAAEGDAVTHVFLRDLW